MENEKSKETILDTDTKGVPLLLFSPPWSPFSPSLGNINECGKLSSPWKHLSAWDSRCDSMQMVSTLSCLGIYRRLRRLPIHFLLSLLGGKGKGGVRTLSRLLVEWKCDPVEVRSGYWGCPFWGIKVTIWDVGWGM